MLKRFNANIVMLWMLCLCMHMTWCLGRWGTVGWSDSLVLNAGSSGTGSNSPATQTCTPPPAAPAVCFVIDLRGQVTERERDNEKRMSGIQDGCTPVFGFAHVRACLMSSWLSIPGLMCWKYSLGEPFFYFSFSYYCYWSELGAGYIKAHCCKSKLTSTTSET